MGTSPPPPSDVEPLLGPLAGDLAPGGRINPFVAAITHELRTPLQAIIGFGQLAMMDWPEGVDRRYLTHIDHASRLMLRVVNDLLDLSHLENGTLDIEHDQPLDVHALLQQVLCTADSLRLDKPIRLYADVDEAFAGRLHRLRGDGKRIEQVLLNLVANAIRFTDEGQVVLGVRGWEGGPGEVVLRLSVADSGLGLDPAVLTALDEPVTSGRCRPAPQRGGSGFGLNIVRRLLELHGTTLKTASVQGGGTLMWFDLTLGCDEAPTAPMTAPGVLPVDALVLTQDERLCQTVRVQWAAQGLSVRQADSPESAPCAAPRWLIDASAPQAQAWLARAKALGCQAWLVTAGPVEAVEGQPRAVSLPQLPQVVFATERRRVGAVDPALIGMRVLVVEDNPLNQRVMCDHLARMGVEGVVAETGARAQALLEAGGWDAALLDMQLPDMSGLHLARWMRARPPSAVLPFAFLSAHLSNDEHLAASVLGARACLLKPFDPLALKRLLREMRPPSATGHGRTPTETGLQALSSLDIRQLMRCEWPALRLGLQRAPDPQALRKAVHAARGALAMLGPSAPLQQARALEEGLLAGTPPSPEALLGFMASVEGLLGLSPPNPG